MSLPLTVVLVIQVLSALGIIVLVLLQQGKGADMGSAFGTGSAGSLFGASGAANFLSRATKWAAVVFFASTASLAWMGHHGGEAAAPDSGIMQNFQQPQDRSVPQAPGAAAPASGASVPAPAAGGAAVPAAPKAADPSVPSAATPSAPAPASTPAAPAK
jgi:preprotein translocase subunit SecG